MRDQGIPLPMQEEYRALSLLDKVNVPESINDDNGDEAGPAEHLFRRIPYARKG